MFFNIGGKLNSPLRLEDARFSAEDLFGILGGYDSCMLTAGTGFLSYDDEKLASSVQTWRKKTVSRMRGTGLFDDDGQEARCFLMPCSRFCSLRLHFKCLSRGRSFCGTFRWAGRLDRSEKG